MVEIYKVKPFDENEINELTLLVDPEIFGLKSYLHFKRTHASLGQRYHNWKVQKTTQHLASLLIQVNLTAIA